MRMGRYYSKAAFEFGIRIQNTFHNAYTSIKFPDEIKQFEALINAFNASPEAIGASSYHGRSSEVEFAPILPFTRTNPKCELADVLFVAYTPKELRVTFLQAKSVNSSIPFPLRLANAEQYALLAKRPTITQWNGKVIWNNNILSDAVLNSIGSFGVFFQHQPGKVEFCYVSADSLYSCSALTKSTYVSGNFHNYPRLWRKKGPKHFFNERTRCKCLADFAAALYSLEIGSPIDISVDSISPITTDGQPASRSARLALSALLRKQLADSESDNNFLLNDLLASPHFEGLRDSPLGDNILPGAASLVVVKGDPESTNNQEWMYGRH